jgi:V8-like Glu-specific endopeptidase
LEKSIVYIDSVFAGTVKVPFKSGTQSYTASVEAGCTGWFASSQAHIVTAAHCVDKDETIEAAILKKVLDGLNLSSYLNQGTSEGWASVDSVTVRAYQPQGVTGAMPSLQSTGLIAQIVDQETFDSGDLALLKIANVDGTPALAVAANSPAVGDKITSIGFPGAVTDVSDASRQRASFKGGTVSSRQVTTAGVPITEIDAAVTHGMSGGPTVDGNGAVVGVNSFRTRGESQAFNFVTDTQSLTAFLNRNGVTQPKTAPSAAPAPAPAPAPAANPFGDLTLILLIAGIVLLLLAGGAVAWVVTVSRRKKRSAAAPVGQASYAAVPVNGPNGAPAVDSPGTALPTGFHPASRYPEPPPMQPPGQMPQQFAQPTQNPQSQQAQFPQPAPGPQAQQAQFPPPALGPQAQQPSQYWMQSPGEPGPQRPAEPPQA